MLWRTPYILWGYAVEYIHMLWRVYPVGYYMLWTTYIYCGDILWTTGTRRMCCGLRYVVDDTFWVFSTTHTPCSPQHIYRRICCGDMLWSVTTFTDALFRYINLVTQGGGRPTADHTPRLPTGTELNLVSVVSCFLNSCFKYFDQLIIIHTKTKRECDHTVSTVSEYSI